MDKPSEVKKLVWKGEVTFEGTPAQFKAFADTLTTQPISIGAGGIAIRPGGRPGYRTLADFGRVGQQAMVERMQNEAVRMPLPGIFSGHINSPHFHAGDEVLLVSKEQFKTFLGEVARRTTEDNVEAETDFYTMIQPFTKTE
jgi:hypothetical protein